MDIFLMLMIVSDIPKMISCESVSKEKRKVLPVEHHHTFHESVILVAQDVGRSWDPAIASRCTRWKWALLPPFGAFGKSTQSPLVLWGNALHWMRCTWIGREVVQDYLVYFSTNGWKILWYFRTLRYCYLCSLAMKWEFWANPWCGDIKRARECYDMGKLLCDITGDESNQQSCIILYEDGPVIGNPERIARENPMDVRVPRGFKRGSSGYKLQKMGIELIHQCQCQAISTGCIYDLHIFGVGWNVRAPNVRVSPLE